jgi:hypothetical protein
MSVPVSTRENVSVSEYACVRKYPAPVLCPRLEKKEKEKIERLKLMGRENGRKGRRENLTKREMEGSVEEAG